MSMVVFSYVDGNYIFELSFFCVMFVTLEVYIVESVLGKAVAQKVAFVPATND